MKKDINDFQVIYSEKSVIQRVKSILLLFFGFVFFLTPSAKGQTHWWNDAVFYEVFVRSFKDNNGDGKGDLKGLIEKLDYLNDGDSSTHHDLGITAIWLMPIQESPSYHGYDVTDYRTIEQDYGSNQDFSDFITAAHDRGIKVIIDYVMNHTSSQHPWFIESATGPSSVKRDWYVWQDTPPAMTGPWGQTVWYPQNASNYYAIFWSGMPDLNYTTQAVKDEMFDVARFWLEDMEVDGFRLDAVKYIVETGTTLEDTPETINFWKDFKIQYKSINAEAFAVGEAWTTTNKVGPYVNNNGLDFCFEFDMASAILTTANTGVTTGLKSKIDEVISTYPFLQYGTFLTNHDMNRVMTQLGNSTPKAKVAANLLLTLPGVPYLYYGEEIGMTGSGVDENKRTPLQWDNSSQAGFTTGNPWRAVNADYAGKNIMSQQLDATSLWNSYRKLIALRNNQTALRRGSYQSVSASSASVISFLRQYGTETLLIVSNTGSVSISNLQLTSTSGNMVPGNYQFVELLGGDPLPVTIMNTGDFSSFTIGSMPAQSTYIYKLLGTSNLTTDVIYEIDMNAMIASGDFNPTTETVDIVASFNNFGLSFSTNLSDANNDGIYSISISNLNVGSKVEYKYRINGTNDGREEFPNSVYLREYVVLEGDYTVKDSYEKVVATSTAKRSRLLANVYPVPTNSELFVEFSMSNTGDVQYQISDLMGSVKKSSSFDLADNSNQQSISLEGLTPGLYQLSLKNNGISENFRIVIQK